MTTLNDPTTNGWTVISPPVTDSFPCSHFLLTAQHYTNTRWQAIEQAQIFEKTWLYVGDGAQLAPGQVWSLTIAGKPVVITCVAPGDYRAFHNVCPHRAALLCPEAGIHAPKHLVCPYHAWVYDLQGNLVGAPSQHRFSAPFDPKLYDLTPIRLAHWSGFLFISFSDAVPPLEQFLGTIPLYLGMHRRDETRSLFYHSRQVACNWKNYHDNTLCDYHVAIAHRHTLHKLQGPIKHYTHQFEPYTNLLLSPIPRQWEQENTILPDLPERAQTHFFTYGIFPNLHLLGFPNGLLAWIQILPLTVNTCEVRLEVYGIPELNPSPDILQAEFDDFMTEDVALTESVQKGYASGHYTPGPVNELEARIVHQQRLILNALGDSHDVGDSQDVNGG